MDWSHFLLYSFLLIFYSRTKFLWTWFKVPSIPAQVGGWERVLRNKGTFVTEGRWVLAERKKFLQVGFMRRKSTLIETQWWESLCDGGSSLGLSELNWAKEHLLTESKQFQRRGSKFQFSRPDTRHSSILKMTHTGFPGGPVVKNRFAMQRTLVQSLAQEDPTCLRAIKPRRGNYWVCALESRSCNYWSPCALQSVLCNKRRLQWEAHVPALHN